MRTDGVYIEGIEIQRVEGIESPLVILICADDSLGEEMTNIRGLPAIMDWMIGMRRIIERDVPLLRGALLKFDRFAGCDCGCSPGYIAYRPRNANLYGRVIIASVKRRELH